MLKTISKTDDITKFDTGLRFRTLLICNPAEHLLNIRHLLFIKLYYL